MSHPSFHLSLTVLVHYRSQGVFSLRGWPLLIPPMSFHRGTWEFTRGASGFAYETFTLFGCSFRSIRLPSALPYGVPQPSDVMSEFRLLRFRSPLLTESQLFSFPPGTWMFRFPGLPTRATRGNLKSQIPNTKQYQMLKFLNTKQKIVVSNFEHLNFKFVWNLALDYWNFPA